MPTIGIIDVFDRIKPSEGDYCKICFRTSRERKLVNPLFFHSFLRTVNIHHTAYKTDIKVCYICERLAMSAMRFYNAVLLGINLEEIFGWVQRPGIRQQVVNSLTSGRTRNYKMHRVFKCETQYQKRHDSIPYSLKCTNTLLVNIENEAPKDTMGSSNQTPTDSDVILVLDNDPPPLTPSRPPQPVRLDSSLTPAETQLTLHPMVTGSDGRIYVPSLNLQMNNNEFQMVPEGVIQKNINPQPQVCLTNQKGDPLTQGTYQDFIRQCSQSHYKSKEIIQTDGMEILLNFDDSESESKKSRYETDPLSIVPNDGSYDNNIDPSNEKHEDSDVNKGVKMKQCGKEKQPLPSMGRVDWEDKIPMDVISFMDATDPNPGERIMQPNSPALGQISDVRSIENTEEEDVQFIDNVECIDLC